MKRLVVATLDALSVLFMVLTILAAGGAAYVLAGKSVVAAVGGLIGGFLVCVVIFGMLFILLEINASLRRLVTLSEEKSKASLQTNEKPVSEHSPAATT